MPELGGSILPTAIPNACATSSATAAELLSFRVPQRLAEAVRREGTESWLASLPRILALVRDAWALSGVDDPFEPGGHTAWVAPVQDRTGRPAVLKLARRHPEAEHEAAGLRAWNGDGAVRIHGEETFDRTTALLLEQCVPGGSLAAEPEPEQDRVIAGLLRRLWEAPVTSAPFTSLQAMCENWAAEFEERVAVDGLPLDLPLARDGIALLRELPATADRAVLLCTDIHAENVLGAEREPWLVIDPKPHVGDPAYDPIQHLLNCENRLHADPRRFAHRLADLLDLDRERVLLWLLARCVQESPDWPALATVARRIAP